MHDIYSYFVNGNDQIKMIADPERDFLFKINANDRFNEMQKEAMNGTRPWSLVCSRGRY